jgi:hypothetical protein
MMDVRPNNGITRDPHRPGNLTHFIDEKTARREANDYCKLCLENLQKILQPYKDNAVYRWIPKDVPFTDDGFLVEPSVIYVVDRGFWRVQSFEFLINVFRPEYERIRQLQNELPLLYERRKELLTHRAEVNKTRHTGYYTTDYDRQVVGSGRNARVERSGLYKYTLGSGKFESMTDAQKRVAGELSNLPNFTARVKIVAVDGKTLVEHTIETRNRVVWQSST